MTECILSTVHISFSGTCTLKSAAFFKAPPSNPVTPITKIFFCFAAVTASINLGATAGNTKRIAFRNPNGLLDLVATGSVSGDLLQWDGSNFVMSNMIDGGAF